MVGFIETLPDEVETKPLTEETEDTEQPSYLHGLRKLAYVDDDGEFDEDTFFDDEDEDELFDDDEDELFEDDEEDDEFFLDDDEDDDLFDEDDDEDI